MYVNKKEKGQRPLIHHQENNVFVDLLNPISQWMTNKSITETG